jgi:hypothetical protein
MIEQLVSDLVVNQICVNGEGKSVVVKRIFMPNLEGSSLVEFKYVKTAQTQLMPINEFRKTFS